VKKLVLPIIAYVLGLTIIIASQTGVLNPASDLAGKTLVTAEGDRTISGTFSYSVPALFSTGTLTQPGIAASTDTSTGWRIGPGSINGSVSSTQIVLFDTTGLTIGSVRSIDSAGVVTPAATGVHGTWTPVIGGSGGTSGQTYATQIGSYSQLGKIVIASYQAKLSNKGVITGTVQIQGLPLVAQTGAPQATAPVFWDVTNTAYYSLGSFINAASSAAGIIGLTAAATSNLTTSLVTADISNTTEFRGVLVYRTN
jgi:hypothetical protein